MPKINTGFVDVPEDLAALIEKQYTKMANTITPQIAAQYKVSEAALEWDLTITGFGNDVYEISLDTKGLSLNRMLNPRVGLLRHDFFELNKNLQGKGIAKPVMIASVNIADALGIKNIALEANIDVGGYAWLRKGFFPEDGKKGLLEAAMDDGTGLFARFNAAIDGLNDKDLRGYVLTEDFQNYKPLFLGTSWDGDINLDDEIARLALTQSAREAAKLVNRGITTLPTTANEKVADAYTRHQIQLLRFSGGLRNADIEKLTATEDPVNKIVLEYAEKMQGVPLASKEGQKITREFESAILTARGGAWSDIQETSQQAYLQMATLEASNAVKVLEEVSPVILGLNALPQSITNRIVNSQPFEGRTLSEWLKYNESIDFARITRAAKNGITNGLTPTEIARSVVGTNANGRRDGMLKKAFRDQESVYLTVTNGIANQVRSELYKENSDIISEELYVATLDIGTTQACAGFDQEIFKLGTGPIPPLHFRCRSLRIPYLNPKSLNNRPFNPTTEKMLLQEFADTEDLGTITSREQLPRGFKTNFDKYASGRKRELIGQVPAQQNYTEFLRNQSMEFQNEYFGIEKGKIFRNNPKATVSDFRLNNGTELTILELERKGFTS